MRPVSQEEPPTSLLYAGLNVSLETTSICVANAEGRIKLEAKAPSDPEAIATHLSQLTGTFERVGLEAGPQSKWLYLGLRDRGYPVGCIETRHSKAAIAAMSVNKTDRNEARSLAQFVRSAWFKVVHVKSVESRELRTLLGSRKFLVKKLRDNENEIRGQLRPFGLKVGQVSTSLFAERIRDLVEGRPRLRLCMEALLVEREVCDDPLQSGILFLKLSQALHLRGHQPGVLLAPIVEGRIADSCLLGRPPEPASLPQPGEG